MLRKFAAQLDEIRRLEGVTRLEAGMVVPDPERHPIAGISQRQLAIWFTFPGRLRLRGVDLDVDPPMNNPVLRASPCFADGEQFHAVNLARRHALRPAEYGITASRRRSLRRRCVRRHRPWAAFSDH